MSIDRGARRPWHRVAVGLMVASALTLMVLPSAQAANQSATVVGSAVLLPTDRTLTLTDGAPATLLTLAVPAGLTPVRINARLTSTLKRVAQVTSIPTPSNTLRTATTVTSVGATAVPMHAPLNQAKIVNGNVTVSLDIVDPPQSGWCGTLDPGTVTVDEIVLELSGTATPPDSVADFITPSVTGVHVVVPDKPDSSTLEAGLSAVASITHAVGTGASVRLFTKSAEAALAKLSPIRGRVVSIEPSSGQTVATAITNTPDAAPILHLAGGPDVLTQAAGALGSQFIVLADAAKTAGLTETLAEGGALVHPLVDFGAPDSIALTGYGRSTQTTTIQQAAFGGPVDQVTVDLVGSHTSIPADVLASVNIYWNDFLTGSVTLDSTTTALAQQVVIPSSRLRSTNSLMIEFTAVPRQGACQGPVGQLPVGLYIDSVATKVTGERGQALSSGFTRFPQVLAGQLPVAFSTQLDPATEATSAGDIVSSLQLVNPRRFTVSVQSPDDFISGCSTGLFVGATADDATNLQAPVRLTDFRTVQGTSLQFGVGVDQPVAILEGFSRSNCDVLMLGSWAPDGQAVQEAALALQVSNYTVANQFGWLALFGSLLVGLPKSAEPVQLGTGEVVPQAVVTEEYRPYGLWFAIGLGILVLIGLIGAWRRRRRSAKIRQYIEAEIAADEAEDFGNTGQDPPEQL